MILINDYKIIVNYYPDGTPRINFDVPFGHINIQWLYEPNEEMTLYYVVKHIKSKWGKNSMYLHLPYIPNARMDRVKSEGEVFTLKYFCEFINSLGFGKVFVQDPHSSVSLALIDNVVNRDISAHIHSLVKGYLDINNDVIVYPDEGAAKRYSEIITFPHLFGIKNRDWKSGKIIGLDIHGNIPENPFNALIIDDISSYGGTFLYTAKKLKELGAGKIWLYITHCENSILDGELIKSGLLEKIFTTDSIYKGNHDLIQIIGGAL